MIFLFFIFLKWEFQLIASAPDSSLSSEILPVELAGTDNSHHKFNWWDVSFMWNKEVST